MEQLGGRPAPPPLRWCRQLRGRVTVDVLVDPAGVRAEIAAPEAEGTLLRLDRIEGPALEDVGRRVVLILGHFARVAALHSVSPVRPGAVSETTARRDP